MGERHFEILLGRLVRKYGVHAELARPKVAYRETFKGIAEGQGKHKKQSGGRGQYGDCWIRISPLARGTGYEFVDSIVGGVIPNKFIPAVDKGVQEAAQRGPIAGYPCVDFRCECYFGSYHDVDSSEQAFKMAGILAFRNVTPKARPVLLEPIISVKVRVLRSPGRRSPICHPGGPRSSPPIGWAEHPGEHPDPAGRAPSLLRGAALDHPWTRYPR
jgi:elongation factor G